MGDIELGTCAICNKENIQVLRKYYFYDIKCECCMVTEEQVDIMLSRARMQKQDDTYMFTNEYLLSQETPIELPSDEEIEKAMPDGFPHSDGYDAGKICGFEAGAKWMKEQILNQNRLTINETKRSIEGIGLNNQNK